MKYVDELLNQRLDVFTPVSSVNLLGYFLISLTESTDGDSSVDCDLETSLDRGKDCSYVLFCLVFTGCGHEIHKRCS